MGVVVVVLPSLRVVEDWSGEGFRDKQSLNAGQTTVSQVVNRNRTAKATSFTAISCYIMLWLLLSRVGVANRQACATFCCDGPWPNPKQNTIINGCFYYTVATLCADYAQAGFGAVRPPWTFRFLLTLDASGLSIADHAGDASPSLGKAALSPRWWYMTERIRRSIAC